MFGTGLANALFGLVALLCYAGATVLYVVWLRHPQVSAGTDGDRPRRYRGRLQLRLPLRAVPGAEDRPLQRPPRVDGALRPLPGGDEPHPRGPAPRPLPRAVPDAGLALLPSRLLRRSGRRSAPSGASRLGLRVPRHAEHAQLLGLRRGVRPLAPLPRPRAAAEEQAAQHPERARLAASLPELPREGRAHLHRRRRRLAGGRPDDGLPLGLPRLAGGAPRVDPGRQDLGRGCDARLLPLGLREGPSRRRRP